MTRRQIDGREDSGSEGDRDGKGEAERERVREAGAERAESARGGASCTKSDFEFPLWTSHTRLPVLLQAAVFLLAEPARG